MTEAAPINIAAAAMADRRIARPFRNQTVPPVIG
jgi:hypothetical protein